MNEILGFPPEQILGLTAVILVLLLALLLILGFVVRVGKTLIKIGCALLTILLLMVGGALLWLTLTPR